MKSSLLVPILAAVLVITIVPTARADRPGSIGRYLGIGWSDGYHSHAACPPKPHIVHHRPIAAPLVTSAPLPWWKTPASSADGNAIETAPSPSPPPVAVDTPATAGHSLYRQPGEGSSVIDASGPRL